MSYSGACPEGRSEARNPGRESRCPPQGRGGVGCALGAPRPRAPSARDGAGEGGVRHAAPLSGLMVVRGEVAPSRTPRPCARMKARPRTRGRARTRRSPSSLSLFPGRDSPPRAAVPSGARAGSTAARRHWLSGVT